MVPERICQLGRRGYTIVELVIVAAILAVVMAVSMPLFISYWQTSTLKAGAQELVTILNGARGLAIKSNQPVCITSDGTSPAYGTKITYHLSVCSAAAWTGTGTASDGSITLANAVQVGSPATGVVFTALGAASPPAGTAGDFKVRNPTTNQTATVRVATSGRITILYP
jgi:prepilin-type N-terminal cleavage/methylation domain-containing protein